MALLWMDGFDHYGAVASNASQAVSATVRGEMLNGVYAVVDYAFATNSLSRTGGKSLIVKREGASIRTAIRRILGAGFDMVGVGFALYLPNIAARQNETYFTFYDGAGVPQCCMSITSTGALTFSRGYTTALLGQSADGAVVASAWQHVEIKVLCADLGAVEIRVNGVTVLSLVDVNTKAVAEDNIRQVGIAREGIGFTEFYIDDYFCWNTLGDYNNDFIGDKRILTLYPNDNDTLQEWEPVGVATGFEAIDEQVPDGDSTYIEATEAVSVSRFELDNIVENIGSIAGIQTYALQRKTVAGVCNTKVSLVSGIDEANGEDRAITEQWTYYTDVHEIDPATSAPWTKSVIDSVKLKIERTA